MSIADWIDEISDGGIDSSIGQLLEVAYNIEYGAEPTEQSPRSTCSTCSGTPGQGQLRVFGKSNEKYRVRGGTIRFRLGSQRASRVRSPCSRS